MSGRAVQTPKGMPAVTTATAPLTITDPQLTLIRSAKRQCSCFAVFELISWSFVVIGDRVMRPPCLTAVEAIVEPGVEFATATALP